MIDFESFTPVSALVGGALIGLSASLVLLSHGKIAGISGIYGGLFDPAARDQAFRGWFIGGLLLSGLVVRVVWPGAFQSAAVASLGVTAIAGLLVGFGTRLGNGCTSGHGVCGLSRLSPRSLFATLSFVGTGVLSVHVVRHILAVSP